MVKITFQDGSIVDAANLNQAKSVIRKLAKEKKAVEIHQNGVTLSVKGWDAIVEENQSYANYIESSYKGWTIRVWEEQNEEMYGCNYYRKGEPPKTFHVSVFDFADENAVFKYASKMIEDLIGN
jgi:hypothetical protein